MAEFNDHIEKTLKFEGGYVNDPNDAGGETKFGISKRAYPNIDIKNLTLDEAKKIYKRDYWDKVHGDEIISEHIAFELFDTAVNMGVRTASKLLQVASGAFADGVIGNKTLELINGTDEELLLAKFKLAKVARYTYICEKNPNNRKFFYGWIRRTLGA